MCPVVKFIFCIVQLKLYQLLYLLTNNILGKIDYAFDLINYVTLLLSSKTIANSPEYCIYTLVMNTYCINKRGIFLPLSLFFLPSFTGHSLQCSHSFPMLHFSSAVLVSLPYHYRIKNYIFLYVQIQIYIKIQLKHEVMYIIHALVCNISTKKSITSGNKKHTPFRNAIFLSEAKLSMYQNIQRTLRKLPTGFYVA